MKWQFEDRMTQGKFLISVGDPDLKGEGAFNGKKEIFNTIVCNTGTDQQVIIDRSAYRMPAMSILPLAGHQSFRFENPSTLIAWQFNRDFYCISDNDAEVACAGFLFYGIQHPLFISLLPHDMEGISILERLFIEDIIAKDKMQVVMLQSLLKRLIIKVTRLAQEQTENYHRFTADKMDIVRKFNLLLEGNFRTRHEVQFYARAMNRSPKTLTNLFGLCNYPSPSRLIQRRIILEAKRYSYYTDKSAKEVAEELGFMSAAHFSRFFKTGAGVSFSQFKGPSVSSMV